ncbi:hypothetical protein BH11GEM2_BH11GEM2_36920 [soil metagenome]
MSTASTSAERQRPGGGWSAFFDEASPLDAVLEHAPAVGQFMRYFADATLALNVIKKSLSVEDPTFKIDGGEVSLDGKLLAEIEINKPGSDMFSDDINGIMKKLQDVGAVQVMQRVQGTQAVLAVQILDETPDAMKLLEPLWTVLSRLAAGLWHVDGQGFYEQGTLVAQF